MVLIDRVNSERGAISLGDLAVSGALDVPANSVLEGSFPALEIVLFARIVRIVVLKIVRLVWIIWIKAHLPLSKLFLL